MKLAWNGLNQAGLNLIGLVWLGLDQPGWITEFSHGTEQNDLG
jgi:hypothetical protein